MKLILIALIFSSSLIAKNNARIFDLTYRNKLYYSSYAYIKNAVAKSEKLPFKKVQRTLAKIHPSIFVHDSGLDRFVAKNSYLNYPVALRRFFKNDYDGASRRLSGIKRNHIFFVEKNYILGLINLTKANSKKADQYFKMCIKYSSESRRHDAKDDAYVETFRNRCVQQVARLEYARKDFKKAQKYLNYIRKSDYMWPRLLLDKAWTYYWNDERPRSLGTIISFKAPMLQRFMVPEANYLKGLIYYEMCYFDKAEQTYKDFNKYTWRYRKFLLSKNKDQLYKIMMSKKVPSKESDRFLHYYFKGFKRDIKYFSYINSRKSLIAEVRKLKKARRLKQAKIFIRQLIQYNKVMKEDFKDFLQTISYDYYYQIRNTRKFFAKMALMVNLKKREYLRVERVDRDEEDTKELKLSEIKNTDDKFIWDFRGGFWADELGDYAVALKNRCKK